MDVDQVVPVLPVVPAEEDDNEQEEILDQDVEESFEDMATHFLAMDKNEVNTLDVHNLSHMVQFLHGMWCDDRYDVLSIQQRNTVFFGDRSQVLERFRHYSSFAVCLAKRLDSLEHDDDELVKEVTENLDRISANMLFGYDSIIQTFRQFYCNQPDLQASLPPMRMDAFFAPIVEDEMKPYQKLIRYLLEECSRRQYRRQATALFEPKFTTEGHFTRTYTFSCEISEFIYDAIYPYQSYVWLFSALTERSGVAKQCQEYLEKCRDDCLPNLVKDRTKFSYQNGVYDARQNKFYPYGVEPEGWHSSMVCANYIDVVFDHLAYETALSDRNEPLDIPTPNVQKILDSQDFDPEVCRWFYASMGRMIFGIGSMDNWQYFPFCKGTAGSGKSTLLRLAAKFYNDVDVGNLMSEGQTNFSVEHIYQKYVFFCYDVDDKMNFSLTRWNQMVSGETIAVERKFKISLEHLWTGAGAFAGNSYPPWVDQAGNVSRRMLIFMFSKMVRQVDTGLFDKCKLELGAFMAKCVSCYFRLRAEFGNVGVWDRGVLPKYFHDTKRQMQAETNPLQSFLQSEFCVIGVAEHVSFNNFRAAYFAYCDRLRLTKKRLTNDFCSPLFDPQDIAIIDVPVNSNPDDFDGYVSKYIAGVSVQED